MNMAVYYSLHLISTSSDSVRADISQPKAMFSSVSVSYQWEGVGDLAIWRKLCSKAICWEEFVTIVVLDDLPYSFQSHGIRIHLVRAHIMQWGWLGWVTLRETAGLDKVMEEEDFFFNWQDSWRVRQEMRRQRGGMSHSNEPPGDSNWGRLQHGL